jgi:glyoxylase-like metal-dependent hydrolase (beta-lactamase superfamily II)
VAIIDPGPDLAKHIRALVDAVEGAEKVEIVLTHCHGDHASAAPGLAEQLGAEIWGPAAPGLVSRPLEDGESLITDAGDLVALRTPGHTRDHLCLHWPARRSLFAGDLLLGRGDTTWVGEYPGCVADYLDSLARIGTLDLDVIYPTHGPPLEAPTEALERFEAHRRERIAQVRRALEERPDAGPAELLVMVYGEALPRAMEGAAARSLGALLEYVRDHPAA